MLKLLIADYDEDSCRQISAALGASYQIRICHNGSDALDALREYLPDLMILDILLPGIDGISLLQKASEEGRMPIVLAVSRFLSDYIIESCSRLGVSYLMSKPCNLTSVIQRLSDLVLQSDAPTSAPDPRSIVNGMLLNLGFSTKLKGFACLREAILLMAEDLNQSVTKELYPTLAKRQGCTSEQAERLIRSAIENAWKSRDPQAWEPYFPNQLKRPTNLSMISRMASALLEKHLLT